MANKIKKRASNILKPKPRKSGKNMLDNEPIIMVVGGQPVQLAIDQKGKTHRLDSYLERDNYWRGSYLY